MNSFATAHIPLFFGTLAKVHDAALLTQGLQLAVPALEKVPLLADLHQNLLQVLEGGDTNKMQAVARELSSHPLVPSLLRAQADLFFRTLRDYQNEATANTINAFKAGKGNGLMVMPTGTGKTTTFVEIADKILHLLGDKKGLCLVNRVELVDQAKKAFEQVFGYGNVSAVSAARGMRDFSGKMVVAAVQTLVGENTLKLLNPDDYGFVVVDEAHHIVANTWTQILKHMGLVDERGYGIKSSGKFLLGATATPDRSDGDLISKVFTDGIVFSKPLLWFILNKYLLKPQGLLVRTSAKLSQVPLSENGDYQEATLGAALSSPKVLGEVVSAYEQACPGKRALIFASSVSHAHALAQAFNIGRNQPRAAVVHGDMDPDERQKVIDDHKNGRLDLLINYGVLTEGYDDPGIEVVMNLRPTRCRSLYVQMIGRGLRPDPEHPERKSMLVMDFTGSSGEHELEINLPRLFGLEYIEAGLPPIDILDALEQIGKKNSSARGESETADIFENLSSQDLSMNYAIAFQEISLLRAQSNPLSAFLFRKMNDSYQGDPTLMAWDLQIPVDRLSRYFSEAPEEEKEVRQDFKNSEKVLGVSTDYVVELWENSQTSQVITRMLRIAKEVDEEDANLPFQDFMNELCRRTGIAEETLAYRLWHAECRGNEEMRQKAGLIDDLINKHDGQGKTYTRAQIKKELEALVSLAREEGIFSSNIIQEAIRRKIIQDQPDLLGKYKRFNDGFRLLLERCSNYYVYSGELTRILFHNRSQALSSRRLLQIVEEWTTLPSEGRIPLYQWVSSKSGLAPQAVSSFVSRALMDKDAGDVVQRGNLFTVCWEQEILTTRGLGVVSQDEEMRRRLHQAVRARNEERKRESENNLRKRRAEMEHPFHNTEVSSLIKRMPGDIVGMASFHTLFTDEQQKSLLEVLKQRMTLFVEDSLKPLASATSFPLPRSMPSNISWAAQQLETNENNIRVWSRFICGDDKLINILENRVKNYVREVFMIIRSRIEAKGNPSRGDWYQTVRTVTGLEAGQADSWEEKLAFTDRSYNRVSYPATQAPIPSASTNIQTTVSQSAVSSEDEKVQQWWTALNTARSKWTRIDGIKDKQKKLKEGIMTAGIEMEHLLEEAAQWENPAGKKKLIADLLFTMASFKVPSKKSKKR